MVIWKIVLNLVHLISANQIWLKNNFDTSQNQNKKKKIVESIVNSSSDDDSNYNDDNEQEEEESSDANDVSFLCFHLNY